MDGLEFDDADVVADFIANKYFWGSMRGELTLIDIPNIVYLTVLRMTFGAFLSSHQRYVGGFFWSKFCRPRSTSIGEL